MPPPPPHAQFPNNQQQPTTFFNTVLNSPSTSGAQQPPAPSAHTPPRRHHADQAPTSTNFTATQRSLQARNKNYNVSPGSKSAESYDQRQRRDEAACILDSSEMLIWYAAARNESIPQTRNHYQNIVLGIIPDEEDVLWREEWEVPVEERDREYVPSPGKGKEKVRKRVSTGHG